MEPSDDGSTTPIGNYSTNTCTGSFTGEKSNEGSGSRSSFSERSNEGSGSLSAVAGRFNEAYHTIVDRIDALITVNGEDNYSAFVNGLSQRIEKYNNIVAQREGRNSSNEEDTGE